MTFGGSIICGVHKTVKKGVVYIAVVIAVHDGLEFTKRCLQNLISSSKEHEITPVLEDDGPSDSTEKWVMRNIEGAVVLKGDGNLWFGEATQKGFDYIANHPR